MVDWIDKYSHKLRQDYNGISTLLIVGKH